MSKTYMQKEDKKGKRSGDIKCIALSDWASYRTSGWAFVETDEDGITPEQQFVAQESAKVTDRSDNADAAQEKHDARVEGRDGRGGNGGNGDDDDGVSMDNTKAEIVAYLVANDIEHDDSSTKGDLLDLIE